MELKSPDHRWVVLLVGIFGAAVGCWARGWHDTRRHPLGGQVCRMCDRPFRDLNEAGFP